MTDIEPSLERSTEICRLVSALFQSVCWDLETPGWQVGKLENWQIGKSQAEGFVYGFEQVWSFLYICK